MEQLELLIELAARHAEQEKYQKLLDECRELYEEQKAYWEAVYEAPMEITAIYENEEGKRIRKTAQVDGFDAADQVISQVKENIEDLEEILVTALLSDERVLVHYEEADLSEQVRIKVKEPGLLEVPEGKDVQDLPLTHFKKLAKKKGFAKISRGLVNLVVWNKNRNKKLSKWAAGMQDQLSAWVSKEREKNPGFAK